MFPLFDFSQFPSPAVKIPENQKLRKEQYKKGITAEDASKRRIDLADQLRKQQRLESISKRRKDIVTNADFSVDSKMNDSGTKITDLAKQLILSNSETQQQTLKLIRVKLTQTAKDNQDDINELLNANILPLLFRLMLSDDPVTNHEVIYESSWVVLNLLSGTNNTEACMKIVNAGVIDVLFKMLTVFRPPSVLEHIIWSFGNIAGDNNSVRVNLVSRGILQCFAEIFASNPKISILELMVWTISNLARGVPTIPFVQFVPLLPVLHKMIISEDHDILSSNILFECCWIFARLTEDHSQGNSQIEHILKLNVFPKFVSFIGHPDENIQIPSLRFLGNIATGNTDQCGLLSQYGVLPRLLPFLKHDKKAFRKEICWILSNLAANGENEIQQMITLGVLPHICNMIQTESCEIRKECGWVLCNCIINLDEKNIGIFTESIVIFALCDLFKQSDTSLLCSTLEALEKLLLCASRCSVSVNRVVSWIEQRDHVSELEMLQYRDNHDISRRASNIIFQFFNNLDENEDDEIERHAVYETDTSNAGFQLDPNFQIDQNFQIQNSSSSHYEEGSSSSSSFFPEMEF